MDPLFFPLLTLALQWFRPLYDVHLQLLQAQMRVLRSRTDVSRILQTPQEKAELLRLGALVGHDAAEVMLTATSLHPPVTGLQIHQKPVKMSP